MVTTHFSESGDPSYMVQLCVQNALGMKDGQCTSCWLHPRIVTQWLSKDQVE